MAACRYKIRLSLAKRITGLPDRLVALIGGDQITDSAILGCPVPEPVRAILHAVDDRYEPVLQVPDMAAPEPIIDAMQPKEEFAAPTIPSAPSRRILDRSYGAYRASCRTSVE